MQIYLAPMEGVIDHAMRELLTSIGGFDRCVTEFVRVSDVLLPERVFFRLCPELQYGGSTRNGIPVHVQLLGSHLQAMSVNAVRAAELGARGIDINFGCPAKAVNRSDGGSVLLREPQRVGDIVAAVRDAVDPAIPVSAKVRLGFDDRTPFVEVAERVAAAGAAELCVHARTKSDGYKPPAYWADVSAVSRELGIPVIINGEIWSVADAMAARQQSGCEHVMLGRGALACPDLALQLRRYSRQEALEPLPWASVFEAVELKFKRSDKRMPKYIGNRTKQWLAYLKRQYPEARQLFSEIKRLHEEAAFEAAFDAHRQRLFEPCSLVTARSATGT